MRKLFCTGLLLGALSLVFGSTPAANAVGGGGTGCTYMCTCAGQALKCCGTLCTPTSEFGCPQVYNC
jgi:hypothetical protein